MGYLGSHFTSQCQRKAREVKKAMWAPMRTQREIKRGTIPVRREREGNGTLRCDCSSKNPHTYPYILPAARKTPKGPFYFSCLFSFVPLNFSPTRSYLYCDQLSRIPFSKDLAPSACSLEKTLLTSIRWWIPSWQLWLSIVWIKIRNPL